ncbi:hypothetical protein MTBSS4_190045 [Magnetospirillum sp. SS-4]|nr:hypothetical protein MTBSS4_190045 [Magnetospirillum sp. SS-4]
MALPRRRRISYVSAPGSVNSFLQSIHIILCSNLLEISTNGMVGGFDTPGVLREIGLARNPTGRNGEVLPIVRPTFASRG